MSEITPEIQKKVRMRSIKWQELQKRFPDHENMSLLELRAHMSLTDDEIMTLAILEVNFHEENAEWEGFGKMDPVEKQKMITKFFHLEKKSINRKKRELCII